MICAATGKICQTASRAHRQVRDSGRTFQAHRCKHCGRWHVSTITPLVRLERIDSLRRRREYQDEDQ